jgi:serine/threonine-protein kinase
VGKYQIVRRIGEGGMATIYLASSVGPGGFTKPCALKLLRPEFAGHGEMASTLVQEARIAALLAHPNIVQVFDFGELDDTYFMAMEWVDGVALSQLLTMLSREGRTLTIGAVVQLGLAVADALAYLAEGIELENGRASLVHRDVSPSNVLVSTGGLVKLTDFGVVKVLEAPQHTKVGVVKGKYGYMSPEQLRGDSVDHRSDVFALGVVLFESLTSMRLFHRKNLAATVAAVHAARVPPPSAVNVAVPPELDAIVLRALARRPEERWQTARELHDALLPFASGASARAELVEHVRGAQALGMISGVGGSQGTSRPSLSSIGPAGSSGSGSGRATYGPSGTLPSGTPPPVSGSGSSGSGGGLAARASLVESEPPTATMDEFEALEELDDGPRDAYHATEPPESRSDPWGGASSRVPAAATRDDPRGPRRDTLKPESLRAQGHRSEPPRAEHTWPPRAEDRPAASSQALRDGGLRPSRDPSASALPVPEAASSWPERTQAAPLMTDAVGRAETRGGLGAAGIALVLGASLLGTALFWWLVLG